MNTDIIAIGKFKREANPYFDYPEDFYVDTAEGTEIITCFWNFKGVISAQLGAWEKELKSGESHCLG